MNLPTIILLSSLLIVVGCKNSSTIDLKKEKNNIDKLNPEKNYRLEYSWNMGFNDPQVGNEKSKKCIIQFSGEGKSLTTIYTQVAPIETEEVTEEFNLTLDEIVALKNEVDLSLASPLVVTGNRHSCDGSVTGLLVKSDIDQNSYVLSQTICDGERRHRTYESIVIKEIIENYCF